jgi:ParB family transcriptional regulator, chromosome partitioning protein
VLTRQSRGSRQPAPVGDRVQDTLDRYVWTSQSSAGRQKAQAERAEAEKRERRKVLALNKLGDAAMGVRREFVKKLLARLVDCTNTFFV